MVWFYGKFTKDLHKPLSLKVLQTIFKKGYYWSKSFHVFTHQMFIHQGDNIVVNATEIFLYV